MVLSLTLTAATPAAGNRAAPGGLPIVSDGSVTSPNDGMAGLLGFRSADHGAPGGHLPEVQNNVELVSRLEMNTPGFAAGTLPSQIADVAVYKNAAYLNGWSERGVAATCERAGVFVVDISDPSNPRQVAYRASLPSNRYGEGAHVITFPDGRDILAVNNEFCTTNGVAPATGGGGFALYDVSNPSNPTKLVDAAGDYGPVGALVCCDPGAQGANSAVAHEYHSVFMWLDDGRVYLMGVDNNEQAQTDVDVFDITNPSQPVAVREYDFDQEFPILDGPEDGLGNNVLLHDMVVKEIDGIQTLLASYWDGGYVLLNIEDPANATYIGDTRFDDTDPLTGKTPPEGNAHQAEFSHDNRFILAADEDFDQFRFEGVVNPGPNQTFFRNAGTPDEGPAITLETEIEGDTRFIGEGCDPAAIPMATAAVPIAVAERGTCSFQQKVENAEARGYQMVYIFNNPTGANAQCDTLLNMDFTNYQGNILSLFVPRSVGFRMIDAYDPATYRCTPNNAAQSTPSPAAPREGVPVRIAFPYDGWGYAHLYRVGGGKLTEVGQPYAIEEGIDERYANDYGTLSIHEFATDPQVNLAYSSYYSGGLRVLSFGEAGLQEVGRYVHPAGNNFWGVEQFTSGCERLIAASDRDFGLYIFRYTGPGAAQPCPASPAAPRPGAKDMTDPRISLLSNARQRLRTLRTNGLSFRIRVDEASKVEVSMRGRFSVKRGGRGKLRTLKENAAINVAAGQIVTVRVKPTAAMRRKLRQERRLPGLLSVKATDAAGNDATRTKVLSFR
jgi:hypothetical protein